MRHEPKHVSRALAERVETLTAALEALVDAEIEATREGTVDAVRDVFEAVDQGIEVLDDQSWFLPVVHENAGETVWH